MQQALYKVASNEKNETQEPRQHRKQMTKGAFKLDLALMAHWQFSLSYCFEIQCPGFKFSAPLMAVPWNISQSHS